MARTYNYEIAYIIDAAVAPDDITQLKDQITALAKGQGAELGEISQWDRRRLAYPINGKHDGVYIFMNMKSSAAAVDEIVRSLQLNDSVLRHLVIRKDS